jgi:hypothetical protein
LEQSDRPKFLPFRDTGIVQNSNFLLEMQEVKVSKVQNFESPHLHFDNLCNAVQQPN